MTTAKLGCHPRNKGELEGLHLAILLAVVELGHFRIIHVTKFLIHENKSVLQVL